ncbi:MAG: uracil-DNA glycosylase, partial [Proteobacteria bacterium]|nr:uracil-DNA glycosylase [Pseudomonadota bacterium]
MLATLQWLIDAGADEAIGETPIDRLAAPAARRAEPPPAEPAPRPAANPAPRPAVKP